MAPAELCARSAKPSRPEASSKEAWTARTPLRSWPPSAEPSASETPPAQPWTHKARRAAAGNLSVEPSTPRAPSAQPSPQELRKEPSSPGAPSAQPSPPGAPQWSPRLQERLPQSHRPQQPPNLALDSRSAFCRALAPTTPLESPRLQERFPQSHRPQQLPNGALDSRSAIRRATAPSSPAGEPSTPGAPSAEPPPPAAPQFSRRLQERLLQSPRRNSSAREPSTPGAPSAEPAPPGAFSRRGRRCTALESKVNGALVGPGRRKSRRNFQEPFGMSRRIGRPPMRPLLAESGAQLTGAAQPPISPCWPLN
jgi:hypothetical protein